MSLWRKKFLGEVGLLLLFFCIFLARRRWRWWWWRKWVLWTSSHRLSPNWVVHQGFHLPELVSESGYACLSSSLPPHLWYSSFLEGVFGCKMWRRAWESLSSKSALHGTCSKTLKSFCQDHPVMDSCRTSFGAIGRGVPRGNNVLVDSISVEETETWVGPEGQRRLD